MLVSEIAVTRPAQLQTITLQYETRTHVMRDAVRIYRDLGLDCNVDHLTITYQVPKPAAQYLAGLFELCTGHPATIH